MAYVKLITLIVALNTILVSSLELNPKAVERRAAYCPKNPCRYGGQYEAADVGPFGYRCNNCPYPTRGIICEDLTCDPNCFKVGNSVYFIYPNTDRSWVTSYSKCVEEGMRMPIFKDKSVLDPVRRKLAAHNVDHPNENNCYWIGLNRTSSAAPWKWVDGTDRATKQPWVVKPTTQHQCGEICSGTFSYNISSDFCDSGSSGWQYFSLCEKTLPITLD